MDDRFEVIEIWRQTLRDQPEAAVRVLARSEAGADGPDEYAVGITTKADAHLFPMGDEKDLFTGLSFAEAHWLAAILVSATRTDEEAESLLFDLRMPVELTWRDIELAPEVIEPNGIRSQPLVHGIPRGPPPSLPLPSPHTRSTVVTRPSSYFARIPRARRFGWRRAQSTTWPRATPEAWRACSWMRRTSTRPTR